MPVLARRRPSMDLRKSVKVALQEEHHFEQASLKQAIADSDNFSIVETQSQKSDSEMDFPAHKLASLPSRQKSRKNLRLTTSSPVLHYHYQSDEEQPSPSPDEHLETFPPTSNATVSIDTDGEATTDEEEDDEEDTDEDYSDSEFDLATPRLPLPATTISSSTLAIAVPILSTGPARLIDITAFAPMQKRTTNISQRPTHLQQSASLTAIYKTRAPRPFMVRPFSTYSPKSAAPPLPNFSTPLPLRGDSLSPTTTTATPADFEPTTNSSTPISSSASSIFEDETDALMRESDEIQFRATQLTSPPTFSTDTVDWPIPQINFGGTPKVRTFGTAYGSYDPFATETKLKEKVTEPSKAKGWKSLGLGMRVGMGMKKGRKNFVAA